MIVEYVPKGEKGAKTTLIVCRSLREKQAKNFHSLIGAEWFKQKERTCFPWLKIR